MFHVKQGGGVNLSEVILTQFKDEIFQRTELGAAEIRSRSLSLSKDEEMVLLSISGGVKYFDLKREFEVGGAVDFDAVIDALLKRNLIVVKHQLPLKKGLSAMADRVENFEVEDFFSSSMDPLHSGSGLVVDTKTNTMRSVNLKRKKHESVYDVDIPLSLELDTKLRLKKEKRTNKLVQVFPEPVKPKKRRSKRIVKPPENKWIMRMYVGLTVLGMFLVLIAVAVKM